jgi:hypothetical protein
MRNLCGYGNGSADCGSITLPHSYAISHDSQDRLVSLGWAVALSGIQPGPSDRSARYIVVVQRTRRRVPKIMRQIRPKMPMIKTLPSAPVAPPLRAVLPTG